MSKSPARKIIESLSQPLYQIYSTANPEWHYKGLKIMILPEVFHPNWFVTSRMLLDFLENLDVKDKHFLELGCGTGTQACRAVQKGAIGYASDITSSSCKNAAHNAGENALELKVFQSDIFGQIPKNIQFDVIFVNPPFLEKYPEEERDFAFCCGEEYEYYDYLFRDLHQRLSDNGKMFMALAKSCNCDRIAEMALSAGFEFNEIYKRTKWAETNYLFQISRPSF